MKLYYQRARRTSCNSRSREVWPRRLRPSGHATDSRLGVLSCPTPFWTLTHCAAVSMSMMCVGQYHRQRFISYSFLVPG
jgi:hypothetical protein